jgi:hypothetical protein
MTSFPHFGLYFTPEHVRVARQNRDREPFQLAWADVLAFQPSDVLAAAQREALLYRFNDDANAGESAVNALVNGLGLNASVLTLDTAADAITVAHTFEMVADHPAFLWQAQGKWATIFAAHVDKLAKGEAQLPYVERVWLGLLQLVAGIVLENQARLDAGAAVYRHVISEDVRPEGYIPSVVEASQGGSLLRQLRVVEALTLMAEAASHVGLDLWGFTARGVSIMTPAAYVIYYYYYADKWRWDTVSEDEGKGFFRQHGGFLEILNHHARPKDIKLLLDDMRPFHSPPAGGFPTLTHGLLARRGLFG